MDYPEDLALCRKAFCSVLCINHDLHPSEVAKFINRDRVIRRIVSIVHNGKIKFVEGFHSNYKNLEEKYIKII